MLLVSYLVSFAFIWRGTDRNLHLKIGIQFAFGGGSVLRSHHSNIRFLFLFFWPFYGVVQDQNRTEWS